MNGDEFLKVTVEAAASGEIPAKVSNKQLWALAIDAKSDRKDIFKRLDVIESDAKVEGKVEGKVIKRTAAAVGGAAGLIAAIAALVAAL